MGWTGTQLLVFEWFMVLITFIVVAIRLYVNIKGIRRLPIYREILVVSAWIFFLVVVALDCPLNDMDDYNLDTDPTEKPVEEQIKVLKIGFAQSGLYVMPVYLCQVELLFLFMNLIAPRANHPKMFRFILLVWVIVIIGFLFNMSIYFLSCLPISSNWEPESDCQFSYAGCVATTVLLALTDILIYAIPTIIICRMQKMSIHKKLSAGAMFLLGFLNIFCGLFGAILNIIGWEASWELWGASLFLISLQQATAIIIVCMPQARMTYRLLIKDKKTKEEEENTYILSEGSMARKWEDSKSTPSVAAHEDV